MVGEKREECPRETLCQLAGLPHPGRDSNIEKTATVGRDIFNEENPIRIESDRCSTVSFSTCKETVSIAMSGIVSGTPWKFLQNYNSFSHIL